MCLYLLLLLCFCCHIQEVTARLWQTFASDPLALLPGPFLHCDSACLALHGEKTEKETLALEATRQRWQRSLVSESLKCLLDQNFSCLFLPTTLGWVPLTSVPCARNKLVLCCRYVFWSQLFFFNIYVFVYYFFKLVAIMTCEFSIHDVVCTFSILVLTLTYTVLCTPLPVLKTHIACDMFPSQAILW